MPSDIFRDSPVRYLGYANEIGEAFRSLVKPTFVKFSYFVAFGYVAADSIDKGYKESKKSHATKYEKVKRVSIIGADTLLWQTFASVVIPGFTINRCCFVSNLALKRLNKLPVNIRKWTVTGLGLILIPFIVSPIDNFVELAMDESIRTIYNNNS